MEQLIRMIAVAWASAATVILFAILAPALFLGVSVLIVAVGIPSLLLWTLSNLIGQDHEDDA